MIGAEAGEPYLEDSTFTAPGDVIPYLRLGVLVVGPLDLRLFPFPCAMEMTPLHKLSMVLMFGLA